VPDLLIAATAELAGLAVLHHDEDYDIIADVTGQQLERLRLDEELATGVLYRLCEHARRGARR
jgi:hypothetical protein